ncbi:MAG: OmpA family protein, partial [Sandaracinobacteroides sp.]
MGKFAVAVALATTVLAGAAQARDNSWYIGLEAGGFIAETKGWDIESPTGVGVSDGLRNKYEPGWEVGGVLGYDFGAFRSEFEVSYKNANLDSVTVAGGIPPIPRGPAGGPFSTTVPPAGRYDGAVGNAQILTFMLNGMFDFGA